MKRSTERILTSHVGSLPRPQVCFLDVTPSPAPFDRGQPGLVDDATWQAILRESIAGVVHKQAELGVDVISDGEFGKSNWQAYIMERVTGFEGRPVDPPKWGYIGQDLETFEDFYRESRPELFRARTRWVCTGPIVYDDAQIQRDIANFKAALEGVHVEEAFMPGHRARAASPSTTRTSITSTTTLYVRAVADVLEAGVSGDHRRRILAASRRRDPGQPARRIVDRRRRQVPALGRITYRGAQLRARRHPGRQSAVSPVLG